MDDGDHQGQLTPGYDVIDGSTGEGQGSYFGAQHFFLREQTRQHWKGGDCHRRSDQEHEGYQGRLWPGKSGVERKCKRSPQDEWKQDATEGGNDGLAALAKHDLRVQARSQGEHVEDETNITQRLQCWKGVGRKYHGFDARQEGTQQGRPQRNACQDFTDDPLLTNTPRQMTENLHYDQDDDKLE